MKVELTDKQVCEILKETSIETLCAYFKTEPYKFMSLLKILFTNYLNREDLVLNLNYILNEVPIQKELF